MCFECIGISKHKHSGSQLYQLDIMKTPGSVAETEPRAACPTQDLTKLKPAELTPLSPEVISRQATINIGTLPYMHSQYALH